jgi:hypothetical protein
MLGVLVRCGRLSRNEEDSEKVAQQAPRDAWRARVSCGMACAPYRSRHPNPLLDCYAVSVIVSQSPGILGSVHISAAAASKAIAPAGLSKESWEPTVPVSSSFAFQLSGVTTSPWK